MASRTHAHATELREIEAAIEAAEGPYHVEGHYYADPFDAERQRRASAERQLRQTLRTLVRQRVITTAHAAQSEEVAALYLAGETHCVWCEAPFTTDDAIVPAGGGRLMHESPCSEEYDALAGGLRLATVEG